MKNEKTMATKTTYQQLLEKLDDEDFARQFQDEKQKEIEELIAQILMITSGVCVAPKDEDVQEWGHENFFKIFDILMIRHKNFHTSDILENLKFYLFNWTNKHSEAYREWSDKLEVIPSDFEKQEAPEQSDENKQLNKLAAQISEVLKNPLLPTNLYNIISDELNETSDQADSPEWILANLKSKAANG